jgi:hypothetical protein
MPTASRASVFIAVKPARRTALLDAEIVVIWLKVIIIVIIIIITARKHPVT